MGRLIRSILDFFFGEDEKAVESAYLKEAVILARDEEIEVEVSQLRKFLKIFCPKIVTGFNLFEYHNPVVHAALNNYVLKLRVEQSELRRKLEEVQTMKGYISGEASNLYADINRQDIKEKGWTVTTSTVKPKDK